MLALMLSVGSAWFAATHFKINTDVNQIISANLPWRQLEKEMDDAFPQKTDRLVIVIDGANVVATEEAAVKLTEKLSARTDLFKSVVRPDAIPFFHNNGLLFLSKDELADVLDSLSSAQPLIGMLASDPSLRGLMNTLNLMLQGVKAGQADFAQVQPLFAALNETMKAALAGQDKPLPLDSLMAGGKASSHDLRKFILAQPILDFTALSPGAAASDVVRAAAVDLHLTAENGIHVRLTGPVALSDEEFSSVTQGAGWATGLSTILVFVILLLALKSLRIVLPILFTLIVGLLATTAFALAAIGSLNLISVAFAVMFIGIAVDFGIQFGVRYRDQHHQEPNHEKAMTNTARVIAVPLAMAAASTAVGFLTFIPTDYRGVSELGLIAGVGMLIAFFLNVTLLPALLTLTRPPAEAESIGYRWLAPVDIFLVKRRPAIMAIGFILALGGLAVMTQLRFDFDPLNLKDPKTESVSTLFDVMGDPDATPYTIEILQPNLQLATALASKLNALPEVDHAMTLASFVPEDQEAKLALIKDTKTLLDPTFGLPRMPDPDEAAIYGSIDSIIPLLHDIGGQHEPAQALAALLEEVSKRHDPALIQRLQNNIIGVMQYQVNMVHGLLDIEPVTIDSITDDLRRDWVTSNGRALVEVYPKENARDHKNLMQFTKVVQRIAPNATGAPISIQESGRTVTSAFIHAGLYAVIAIAFLAFVILRRFSDVVRLLTPLILAGILTLASIVLIRLPLNYANIIALPLLLSLGVSYSIYFISYWRSGQTNPLQSSMARAVLFSAATVLVAFGSLALSAHPGTAGMGELLTLALLYCLLSTFIFLPSLLSYPKIDKH
jgi:hopanoid biosynthesis associated RND transporter like protein HpnN